MSKNIALITGATSGIGNEVALCLSKNNYKVLISSRRINKLEELQRVITDKGGDAAIIQADLSDNSSVQELVNKIKNSYPKLDLICNIAGIWHSDNEVFAGKDFIDFDANIIKDTYSVGFTSPTLLLHGLIPLMSQGSHIINLTGTFENGAKGWLPYYASKKALEDLTFGLSQELKDKGIFVNGVSPSDTATEEYAKWFPEYIEDAIKSTEIADLIMDIINTKRTGTVQVIKKYSFTDSDISNLKQAIKMAQQSFNEGSFPAGAVIVNEGEVITQTTSASFPKINFHAESKAIDNAINELNQQLSACTLYASMEPCLMCLSRAYWAGIRRIVFAVKKESVPYELCYESNHNHYDLLEKFNEKIELVHVGDLQNEALIPVKKWLEQNS